MASSSSSSSFSYLTSESKYDVFLNFRGEDTRDNFISHLYAALCRKQIKTFIDDEELRRGDEISPALLNAIKGSKISIIVFSNDYASSKWCLGELVKILQCHQNGQIVVPVFYHVNPSDVQNQNGSFRDAFVKHENQLKEMPEMVQNWKDALTEASKLSGWTSKKIRSESRLVDVIVNDVLKKLEKYNSSSQLFDGLVGLNSRIEQIKSLLCMELSDIVEIIGIWGMGGIGKTALATAIFNQFSVEFEGSCFIEDVRRKSEIVGGLKDLQNQIFPTILREKLEVVEDPNNIPQIIRERVRCMKVFIILDDVNKVGQLDDLIGELNQFGPGSRIVLTTRDKRVLEKFGVEKIFRVDGLGYQEAFELFYNHAFKEYQCPKDIKGHSSWRLVEYGKSNPLVLKPLYSSFHLKNNKIDWENIWGNSNEICSSDTYDIDGDEEISFNELTTKEISIFSDIASFFMGEGKNFVPKTLDDSKSNGSGVLVDDSIVTISDNCLQMDDLVQEMEQKIVSEESFNKPGKRSRL